MTETQWLTRQQVADQIGFTTKTLSNWRHLGQGPKCFKVQGRYRYKATDVRAWQEAQQGVAA
ncbi:helix-turn-helix domain-containing protein [Nocardia higoensis]|uniref:Helix-turn-helix domain-containing protein n=1 Tax=Nocardia higoensis TaxID=228599 RepID=A0ABS0DIE8_9NOCA|nr:helix-turn-helix domain-containing protein [Nocardia higoensis]MBF6358231.1 helix-turn-helix domain-containing protein [Nocardia higoensis]